MRAALLAASALLLAASALSAQQPDTLGSALEPGSRLLAFGVPDSGGGSIAVGRMRGQGRQVLWVLSGQVAYQASKATDENSSSSSRSRLVAVEVGPQTRRYLSTAERVVPYVASGLALGFSQNASSGVGSTAHPVAWTASTFAGGGLEWFPAARASLRADAGLRVMALYSRYRNEDSGARFRTWHLGVGTFTSALSLQLYTGPRR